MGDSSVYVSDILDNISTLPLENQINGQPPYAGDKFVIDFLRGGFKS